MRNHAVAVRITRKGQTQVHAMRFVASIKMEEDILETQLRAKKTSEGKQVEAKDGDGTEVPSFDFCGDKKYTKNRNIHRILVILKKLGIIFPYVSKNAHQ